MTEPNITIAYRDEDKIQKVINDFVVEIDKLQLSYREVIGILECLKLRYYESAYMDEDNE